MYEREMTEVRSSKQVEISEIDGRLQEHYQARLQSALQELRDHHESQMKQNRDEVEVLYQNKVSRKLKHASYFKLITGFYCTDARFGRSGTKSTKRS